MTEKTINTIGIIVGVAWFAFVITVGWQIFEYLAGQFGDQFGAISLFYLFGLLAVLFVGRAILEQALIATFKIAKVDENLSVSVISTSGQFTDARPTQLGAVAACTIVGIALFSHITIDNDNLVSSSETSARIVWINQ